MSQADTTNSSYLLDDLPAEQDALDFQPYVNTIVELIKSPNTSTPLTLGIFGDWGSGKTSLMRMVSNGLPSSYRKAWFDAWKYEKETDLWRALLLVVLDSLQGALPKNAKSEVDKKAVQQLEELRTSLYRPTEREEVGGLQVNWGKLATGVAQGSLQIGLSLLPVVSTLAKMAEELQKEGATTATEKIIEALQRQRSNIYIDQVQFLEQFQDKFHQLIDRYVRKRRLRLVVFVDDLDRCLPEKAVEVLEAIKLFLDVPGCIFLLGLDDKVIARGVEIKYRQMGLKGDETGADRQRLVIDGTRYLEKIIQLPFQLPPIEKDDMQSFVSGLIESWEHTECPRVFAEGLGRNPRQVKRTVNLFLMLARLAKSRKMDIQPVRLAKIVVIQNAYREMYDFLKEDNHRYLRDWERYMLAEVVQRQPAVEGEGDRTERIEVPTSLEPFLRGQGIAAVRRVLSMHPGQEEYNFSQLPLEELRYYFSLTRRAEAPQVATIEAPRRMREPELVRIPAGAFWMGSDKAKDNSAEDDELPQHQVELPEYWIGRYPVTNAEYQDFVLASGHNPPRNWDGSRFPEGKGDHPVIYVTWWDAQAYCEWLQKAAGKVFRLPTEAEWEKAARGGDRRIYPWGQAWDNARGNAAEGGKGDTTPVGAYSPAGDSPYGCADMAGNVWEWTSSLAKPYPYDPDDGREEASSNEPRVVRGGSFDDLAVRARCASRISYFPVGGWDYYGFRVVGGASPISVPGS